MGRCYLALAVVGLLSQVAKAEPVDFSRQIRPLLSDTCFPCHGPDAARRQADLRLDTPAGLFDQREGSPIIVPGSPDESELLRRITAADDDERMPPADAPRKLDAEQIALIRRWVAEGARWQQHWAFEPLRDATAPANDDDTWGRNEIDRFVLARLRQEGWRPAEEADRWTLIRRVTLDLTGLPPTPREVDAFVADPAPDAYAKLVDRLLQSPAYGERMALSWLEAARYADTSGYQNDGPREMWRWRDWVIAAYNSGMPFDQFTIEQLAGDLLPRPTLEQRIATGFNRNHRGNAEGGVIPEEFQVEYVVDRVETTGTVWLGLTIGCARCHDHKYDPISQREFYQLFAFFNNVPENGRAIKEGNSPPLVQAPTDQQQRRLAALDARIDAARQEFHECDSLLDACRSAWEAQPKNSDLPDWTPSRGRVAHYTFDQSAGDGNQWLQYEAGEATFVEGVRGEAASFDGQRFLVAKDVGDFGYFDKFSISAWIRPRQLDAGTVVSRMTDASEADGYYVQIHNGRVHVNLVKRWLDDSIRVHTQQAIEPDRWTHLLVTYDGSRVAKGIRVYLDGAPADLQVDYDFINQSFASKEPLRIGGGGGPDGRFRGSIDEVAIYERCLTPAEAAMLAARRTIAEVLAAREAERSSTEEQKLAACFLAQHAPASIREAHEHLLELQDQRQQLVESLPTVMVMGELPEPRSTFVLMRGEYDKPGEQVFPAFPSILPALPERAPTNRLGLARWLTDPSHPLTARVAVNRYWQMYFGHGLVKTAEDFGSQGDRPSHPELLDWLAAEFVRSGWDVKAMQRLIVTSGTYRQSALCSAEQLARDPENRLLARGPRLRLPAETIRDQALCAAGLLTQHVGGASVKPYQPSDLWKDIATDNKYEQDHGENLYRLSLYTYWKRTVMPPAMAAFDSEARETCRVLPRRTNTPLQALTLMNDVTFVEAARVLAQKVIADNSSPDQRLTSLFRAILVRPPRTEELLVLRGGLNEHLNHFSRSEASARELISAGEHPLPPDANPVELAAYTTIASLLLNLDEAVTKQ